MRKCGSILSRTLPEDRGSIHNEYFPEDKDESSVRASPQLGTGGARIAGPRSESPIDCLLAESSGVRTNQGSGSGREACSQLAHLLEEILVFLRSVGRFGTLFNRRKTRRRTLRRGRRWREPRERPNPGRVDLRPSRHQASQARHSQRAPPQLWAINEYNPSKSDYRFPHRNFIKEAPGRKR